MIAIYSRLEYALYHPFLPQYPITNRDGDPLSKCSIPGSKGAFRLFGKDGYAILDLMTVDGEVC